MLKSEELSREASTDMLSVLNECNKLHITLELSKLI